MKDPVLDAFERSTAASTSRALRVKNRVRNSLDRGARSSLSSPYARFGGMAVATGALVLAGFVLMKGGPPSIPVYSVEPLGGGIVAYRGAKETGSRTAPPLDHRKMAEEPAQPKDGPGAKNPNDVVFDQNSVIRWIARPLRDVPDAQHRLRASLLARGPNGEERVLEGDLRPSSSGAYEIRRSASEYFQRRFGAWELRLVIGDRASMSDVLRSGDALMKGSFQVFESKCTYVPLREE